MEFRNAHARARETARRLAKVSIHSNPERPHPMTALERLHRSRQRRRNGDVLVTVLLGADGVADLVELGWLQEGASAQQTRAALVKMMSAALEMRIEPPEGYVLRVSGGGT
jgi:hypothetical protein